MMGPLSFDFPLAWQLGVPVALALLGIVAWRLHRRGVGWSKVLLVTGLRAAAFCMLLVLLARPTSRTSVPPPHHSRRAIVLLDRSESMSLSEREHSRFQQALSFFKAQLSPTLEKAGIAVEPVLFDETAESAANLTPENSSPKGKRTNLGGAIAQVLSSSAQPPLGIIALTDGAANENQENGRALELLNRLRVPFVAVGFGSDTGSRTLNLRNILAPNEASARTAFTLAAHLEAANADTFPSFDLLLFRDDQLLQRKNVAAGKGPRIWLESFQVSEDKEGTHNYRIQLVLPDSPGLRCLNVQATSSVRISNEKELRALYIQGALTWDYKFVNRGLQSDPMIKLTGLTRTSQQSVFRQNVESESELLNGFPTTLEQLAPFRVVVLSNLKAADLSPAQQQLLALYCGELGGGVLMLGGPATFDSSWQGTVLEKLVPVVFASSAGIQGLDRPFHLQITPEGLAHPVFNLDDSSSPTAAWAKIPTFTQFGKVDAPKPGATVWATHETEEGPKGKRILMASQRYGAGQSAVICIQNFWRWRLARDSDPAQFDRFWRQLFRFLSESGRPEVSIQLAEQDLRPQSDVRLTVEKQPNPHAFGQTNSSFVVRVEDARTNVLHRESLQLKSLRPIEVSFFAPKAGIYRISVLDSLKSVVAQRQLEIREANVELQNTARNMESLKQWAASSGGVALKAEECVDARRLLEQLQTDSQRSAPAPQARSPLPLRQWMLAFILGCLSTEWFLRKQWNLIS